MAATAGSVEVRDSSALSGKQFVPLALALCSNRRLDLTGQPRSEGAARAASSVADQGVGRKDLLIALPAAQHDFAILVDRDLTVSTTAQLGGAPLADVAAGQPVGEVTWDRDRADPRRTHVCTGTAPIRCSRTG